MNNFDLKKELGANAKRDFDSVQSGSFNLDHQRLGVLYEISKCLTSFDGFEKTFLLILELVAEIFPLRSVVLVEKRGSVTRTYVWPDRKITEQVLQKTIERARRTFSYLIFSNELDSLLLQESLPIEGQLQRTISSDIEIPNDVEKFISFPLVVNRETIFGLFQFESAKPAGEPELQFANALANLVAVAFDRQFRADEDRQRLKNASLAAHAELDESIKWTGQLEEEKALRERFVQMLSHDLRNPLSAISMAAQLLRESESLSNDDRELVHRLLRNAKRLDLMTESLLDANRLNAGEKLPLYLDRCDLHSLIEELVTELNEINGNKRVLLTSDASVFGIWDSIALRRVIENLIGSALKYGEKNKNIQVTATATDKGALITVHNFGEPIPPADQLTLFDQFRRTRSAEVGNKKGWGLGLTLVRGLCEAHGGKVWVKSEKLAGTTFFVRIPYDSSAF